MNGTKIEGKLLKGWSKNNQSHEAIIDKDTTIELGMTEIRIRPVIERRRSLIEETVSKEVNVIIQGDYYEGMEVINFKGINRGNVKTSGGRKKKGIIPGRLRKSLTEE